MNWWQLQSQVAELVGSLDDMMVPGKFKANIYAQDIIGKIQEGLTFAVPPSEMAELQMHKVMQNLIGASECVLEKLTSISLQYDIDISSTMYEILEENRLNGRCCL